MIHDRAPVSNVGTGSAFFRILSTVRASGLSPTERLVLLMLASRTGDFGTFPGHATIAADTGFDVRTVERTLARLAAAGWLSWQTAASVYRTNVYTLTPPPPPLPKGPGLRRAAPRQTIGRTPADDRSNPGALPVDLSSRIQDPVQCEADPSPPPSTPAALPTESTHTTGLDLVGEAAEDELDLAMALAAELVTEACDAVASTGSTTSPAPGPCSPPSTRPTSTSTRPTPPSSPPTTSTRPTSATATTPSSPPSTSTAAAEILSTLRGLPELQQIASPAVADRLAAETRRGIPLAAVLRALTELADHAGDAAAVGRAWPVDVLMKRARSYVRGVRLDAVERPLVPAARPAADVHARRYAAPDRGPERRGDLPAHLGALRTLVASIGRPSWEESAA